jgi:hypothetical protein
VPKPVQQELFKQWVASCRTLYNIAFLQWRYRQPRKIEVGPDGSHTRMLEESILKRIVKLTQELVSEEKINEETKENSKIPEDFLVKYKIVEDMKSFFINGFQTVGWSDPFPDDDQFITGSCDDGDNLILPEKIDDWVYPEIRLSYDASPYQIYIPKKEIMLKMMRACIAVKKPQDLWVNQDVECDTP